MNEFNKLSDSYITTIHLGVECGATYNEAKHGNGLLHRFCSHFVDNSSYSEIDKQKMKQELEQVKDVIAQEIDQRYSG